MANQEHLDILTQGIEAWNQWRKEHPDVKPDLTRADLRKADLSDADLTEATLTRADLRKAYLNDADLSDANLFFATLTRANLTGTNLTGATLTEATFNEATFNEATITRASITRAILSRVNLTRANLSFASLTSTNLTRANLTRANLRGADLRGANLREVKLEKNGLRETILREANLSGQNLNNMDFSGMDLSDVNLNETSLIKTNFSHANLSNCSIYGIAAWDIQLDEQTVQKNLTITPPGQSAITVDNLKIAQFIYLLLNNKEIRDVINTITTKVVLILGRFTPERKAVLDALREALRNQDYLPILFDFEKPSSRNVTETVRTLAHLARFIIADLTDPSSIPQELQAIAPTLAIPIQPVLLEGKKEYAMFVDFLKTYHWVLPIHFYKDKGSLLASLKENVIEPAEQKAQELEKR